VFNKGAVTPFISNIKQRKFMKKNELECFPFIRGKRKLLLTMKLTLIFLLACFMQLSATVYSQSTKLTLDVKDKRIEEVLREIEENSDFRFFYQREQVDVEKKISISVDNKTVENILNEIFDENKVTYEIRQDNLILLKKVGNNRDEFNLDGEQQKTINGTVTDETGATLPGVTVIVKGSSQGTVTNENGQYVLSNVPDGATLIFSFVGMRSKELPVGNQTMINVSLERETIGLEEVVAVGYGVQKKLNLTGAISTVTFDEEVDNRPITNASQALGGKITGVWVSQNSGKPGSDEA
jgi:hypothetical protein